MDKREIKRILKLSLQAGIMMLEFGAETYRVEETINNICLHKGIETVQSFVIPTGIFVNIEYDGEYYSVIHRTNVKTIDLEIISKVNSFSRRFATNDLSIDEAEKELIEIENAPKFSMKINLLAGGLSGGFFSLLFGGNYIEFILAFITSLMVVLFSIIAGKYRLSFFIKSLIGGMINMLVALLLVNSIKIIGIEANIDSVIIGSLMSLVPGVAIVNSIRDIISGDFVSGTSRLTEAVLIAIALALGVGSVLQGYIMIFGGKI